MKIQAALLLPLSAARIQTFLAILPVFLGMAQSAWAGDLAPVDAKHMLRGYCYAGSEIDKQAPGGFGPSDNAPKPLGDSPPGQQGHLALVALPGEIVPFAKTYRGMRLLLINRTKNQAAFPASDSRLSLVQEARDAEGNWKPIEYLPSSWCGNSHHRVFLPAGRYWEFAAPAYTGTAKTKLRFVLQGEKPLYSNEFDGSINPEQFTEKEGHNPTNLMDPYNE